MCGRVRRFPGQSLITTSSTRLVLDEGSTPYTPTNFMKRQPPSTDVAWEAYYIVVQEEVFTEDGNLGSYYKTQYIIADKNTKEKVSGPYRDYNYARKQARRRYKKLVRNMERALMS